MDGEALVRNERWLVAGAAALVLAGGITYVAAKGPVTAEHLAAQRLAISPRCRRRDRDAGRWRREGRSRHPGADHGVWRRATRSRWLPAIRAPARTGGRRERSTAGGGARHLLHRHRRRQEQHGRGNDRGHALHHQERDRTLQISSITPSSAETVGVGMPIIVDFNYDVAHSDRGTVEHALEVGSDYLVAGVWFWASDSQVVFRPQSYWPDHEHVLLTAHLTGVPGGPGLWAGSDLSRSFTIGDSHIVKVNLRSDYARFYINGSLARKIPVSGGMGGYDSYGNDFYTTSGVHLTMGSYDRW